jgi:CRISPR-associated endonuclease/helicase Cas3
MGEGGRGISMKVSTIYQQLCGFHPYPEQKEIFSALSEDDQPLLIRLPCGYGKTEAVVVPFLAQALKDEWRIAPRLIYVLPTKALCNQIYTRISDYAKKVGRITVGIEHGASSLDPLFFADICITTFDQFLYGYCRTKPQVGYHIDMPAGSFANSLVVFDEAHLYSPYTHSLMKALLDILCEAKVRVVVMTATMPQSLQDSLFEGIDYERIEFKGNHCTERKIVWELAEWEMLEGDKPSEQLEVLLREYRGKRVLIVVNRVNIAQRLAKGTEGSVLIHSRFSVADRDRQEAEVLKILGRNGREGVVISTQVCEVGLDISCDLLITECASSDALIQRIGRVVRWGGKGSVIITQPRDPIPYKDKKLGEKGDFVEIARSYLKEHREMDFVSWKDLANLSDQMPYYVGYVEARNALGQLFEQTLYADEVPYSLSARDELYCTVFCVKKERKEITVLGSGEVKVFERGKKETKIPYFEIKDACMNLPYYWFRKKGKGLKTYRYSVKNQVLKDSETTPQPFCIYGVQIEDEEYQPNIGFLPKEITEDEEACLIC